MSSHNQALLARAALFRLEALEPRWLLSAGGSIAEAIPLDIEAGAQISGEIYNEWYAFSAEEGKQYFFSADSWNFSVDLRSSDEAVLAHVDRSRGLLWTAPRSETFFIFVSGPYNGWSDAFTAAFTARVFADDYSDTLAGATEITAGTTVQGHIEGDDDQDWF